MATLSVRIHFQPEYDDALIRRFKGSNFDFCVEGGCLYHPNVDNRYTGLVRIHPSTYTPVHVYTYAKGDRQRRGLRGRFTPPFFIKNLFAVIFFY